MRPNFRVEQAALSADAWIDDHDMDRFRRKVRNRFGQEERAMPDVLRRDGVGQIDQLSGWLKAQDDAFQRRRVGTTDPEVRCQGDERSGYGFKGRRESGSRAR
jgi:hypothetical protein